MRMRKKKHCSERMERCADIWIKDPAEYKGRWKEAFGNGAPIQLEIGCGKGAFVTGMASLHPDVNYIAVEKVEDVIVLAMEKTKAAGLQNVRFCSMNADALEDAFEKGEVDRIYLNFSDPWKRAKQAKRRLTHRNFLLRYKAVLKDGGAVCFKTDNRELFEFSLNSFAAEGFRLQNITLDLHASGAEGNIMTEYETRFYELGMPIYRLEAVKA